MLQIELKTVYHTYRESSVVEYYERMGQTRTVYRFEIPAGRKHPVRCQETIVGLDDGFYQEGAWQDKETFSGLRKLYNTLEAKAAQADVLDHNKTFCNNHLSYHETWYYKTTEA